MLMSISSVEAAKLSVKHHKSIKESINYHADITIRVRIRVLVRVMVRVR
jgi:hypothetical protein